MMSRCPSLVLVLLFVYLVNTFISCSYQNKIQKAEKLVTSDPSSLNRVGGVWERSHPCSNDTIVTSSVDTVGDAVIINLDCPDSALASPDHVQKDTSVNGLKISFVNGHWVITGKQDKVRETVVKTVVDRRREELLTADLNQCRHDKAEAEARVAGLNKANEDLLNLMVKRSRAQNWKIWKTRLVLGIPLALILAGMIFKRRIPLLKKLF